MIEATTGRDQSRGEGAGAVRLKVVSGLAGKFAGESERSIACDATSVFSRHRKGLPWATHFSLRPLT